MNTQSMRLVRGLIATALTVITALGLTVLGSAPASAEVAGLMPDISAYCMTNPPFGMQEAANDWKIVFTEASGDPGQNNWACHYLVQMTIPTGEQDFTVPVPVPYTEPLDWNGMCGQQYPGAHAEWIQGPLTGVSGAPWICVAPSGVSYDMAEQSDGTHQVLPVTNGGW